jgi:hypothetical protein
LAAVQTVYEARSGVASLNFTNVPTWSDADIKAQFAAIRDKRYIPDSFDPSPNPRRITWMFPNDGCFDRAEQFNVQVAAAGKTRPAKLFAFSEAPLLHAVTDNTDTGYVEWKFHVVPVVKNSAGQPIVFDPALDPCRPLPYKDWLLLMVSNLSVFDDYAAGSGVTVASTWAYNGDSPVTGEAPHSREEWSFNSETFLVTEEWLRQSQLGRNPDVVLGPTPPWSGYACVKTFPVNQFTVLSTTGTRTLTATCPWGTLNVGGGFTIDPGVRVSKNARNGNGWDVTGTNTGTGFGSLGAQAICLQGAPSNASVSSIQGNVVGIANNAFSTSTASCGAGTLVGGGYTTTVSGTPAASMRIYSNQRSPTNANTWQVSAYNVTGAQKNVTSFAYCLQSSGFTFSQASASIDANGNATPVCAAPKVGMSGGWSFPRTTADIAYNATTDAGIFTVSLSPAPGGSGDPNSKGYEECLAHP